VHTLHQAAAGSAHDIRLVEWMIQMAAFYAQPPLYIRQPRGPKTVKTTGISDQMAIRSTAIAGHTDIVRLMLEANSLHGLNTRTFHEKETLVRLTVKHGQQDLFDCLIALGAKILSEDG
jgi:hypothetical protein